MREDKRYLGTEEATSTTQVVRYLTQNYQDSTGEWMTKDAAEEIVAGSAEEIDRGIRVFRSHVEYLGDEAVKKAGPQAGPGDEGYLYVEPDEDDYYDEDDDD